MRHISLFRAFSSLLFFFFLGAASVSAQDTAILSGLVTAADDGRPLFGASVVIKNPDGDVLYGSAADIEGRVVIEDIEPGSYFIEVDYIAYVGYRSPLTLSSGQARTLHAVLEEDNIELNTFVVSASRGAGKVLDAPSSISILDEETIARDISFSPVASLRNTAGVDVAQTSIDQSQFALRGFNAPDISTTLVLNDYRPVYGPDGWTYNSIIAGTALDLERIEVVRGPASALYGAGGDEGVVHFITKDPFRYPGTSVSIAGGERASLIGEYRHAGVIGERIGYKVTALYAQAREWEFDPSNELDSLRLSQDVYERDYQYAKFNVNGLFTYRLNPQVSLTLNGGHSELTGLLLNDMTPFQLDHMGDTYGQLRLEGSDFFAQAFINRRNTGDSYVYSTSLVPIQDGSRYGAQLQYRLTSPNARTRFIVGGDAEHIELNTQGTVTGRHEDEDGITLIGGYAQTILSLSPVLDLTVALRGDWSNIYDNLQVSPRTALVFKPSRQHTFRAAFNQAFASPAVYQFYLDIPFAQPLDDTRRLMLMVRGGSGYSFDNFRQNPTTQFLLPLDGYFGNDFDVDAVPLLPIYGAAAGGGLIELLKSEAPLPAGELTAAQRDLLGDLMGYTALNGVLGTAVTDAGFLGVPNPDIFRPFQSYRRIDQPFDVEPLRQATTQTFEIGYKGLLGGAALVSVDVYHATKKNFAGITGFVTPLLYLQGSDLTQDVQGALSNVFATTDDPAITSLLGALNEAGLDAEQTAGVLAALVGAAMNDQFVGTIQPDQEILQPGTEDAVGVLVTFGNHGSVSFWGMDAALEILASDAFTVFGNFSVVSDDYFDVDELGEENPDVELALNAPAFKAKFGGEYILPSGLSFNAAGRYASGFPVRSGLTVGEVDSYLVFDLGVGYDLGNQIPGLRADAMVHNLMDHKHRQFFSAPQIGRLAMVRLTYTID